jgi:hypothetical protein
MSTTAPALAPDLVTALKRLKLSTVRTLAPEVLQTAKTQRWSPEELLMSLLHDLPSIEARNVLHVTFVN